MSTAGRAGERLGPPARVGRPSARLVPRRPVSSTFRMRTVVEPLEGNKVKLSVEIEDTEFDRALDEAARKLAREVRMPGFRPGKVPRRVLEARIGSDTLRQEALRESLPAFYATALRESDVDAIAPPEIDITAGEEKGPLAFDAVVEIRPTITVPGYGGLQVTVDRPAATDEELTRQIDRLRGNDAVLTEVQRPVQDGDNVTIDIKTSRTGDDGEEAVEGLSADDFLYEVGSEAIVPELDAHLRGASVGEILVFGAPIASGDEMQFEVNVKDIKEKVLPDLTDEWVTESSEFTSVADLRADLRSRVEMVKRVQATMSLRDLALGALVELVAEDPPEPLVETEVERRLHDLAHRLEQQGATVDQYLSATGQDGDGLVAEMRAGAVAAVKADLALRALADAEGLEADDDDIDAEVARIAQSVGRSVNQVRRNLASADQMPAVRSDVRKTKALAWLVEHVTIVDAEGQPIDRADLEPQPAAEAVPSDREDGGAPAHDTPEASEESSA
jgi:trigger factor